MRNSLRGLAPPQHDTIGAQPDQQGQHACADVARYAAQEAEGGDDEREDSPELQLLTMEQLERGMRFGGATAAEGAAACDRKPHHQNGSGTVVLECKRARDEDTGGAADLRAHGGRGADAGERVKIQKTADEEALQAQVARQAAREWRGGGSEHATAIALAAIRQYQQEEKLAKRARRRARGRKM